MLPSTSDPAAVPDDFPRAIPGSLSGAQPKLSGRLVDGRFVEGLTDEELRARYEACSDLAGQLMDYAKRKRAQLADLPLREFLRQLRASVVKKRWDIDADELTWVMGLVAVAMGGGLADVPGQPALEVAPQPSDGASGHQPVESVVDRALSRLKATPPGHVE